MYFETPVFGSLEVMLGGAVIVAAQLEPKESNSS